MPGTMTVDEKLIEPIVMLVHLYLKFLRQRSALRDTTLYPECHCYALSQGVARTLRRVGVPARVVVGHALGHGFGDERPQRAAHAWVEVEGRGRFDPKATLARLLVAGFEPRYETYEPLPATEAEELARRFGNACGMEDDVYDEVADACVRRAA